MCCCLMSQPTILIQKPLVRSKKRLENFAGCAVIISHDRMFLDRLATHILAFEGDSHVEWFEGNFEDYEQDKIRRLGPDSVNPKRVTYKRLTQVTLHNQLLARQADNNPIRVGVIGVGKFGSMFLAQAIRLPGIHVVGVADLMPDNAKSNLENAHWTAEQFSASSLDDAAVSGNTHVGDDALALMAHPAIEIIVECTGNPIIAVDHLLAAFAQRKHVVSATVEADALCGAALGNGCHRMQV